MPQDGNSLAPVFSAIRSLLILLGTALAAHGLENSGVYQAIEFIAASIMVLGPAAWGVWTSIENFRQKKKAVTQGVNAGMNLAASGGMLVHDDGSPVPATDATAHEIVKVFSPPALEAKP